MSHAMSTGQNFPTERSDLGGLRDVEPNQLGVLIFVTSEAAFFLTLIVTYIVYRPQYTPDHGLTPHDALNVPLTGLFTLFLLSSSVTMGLASARLSRLDPRGAMRWLAVTLLFGLIFLVGQAYEYYRLSQEKAGLGSNLWTSTFFTLTGFHGLHVLAGLLAISVTIAVMAVTRGPRAGARALESVSVYWHFVDAVWIVIFPVVYLWTLLS